jgi:DNA-binding NtrC family response regulator
LHWRRGNTQNTCDRVTILVLEDDTAVLALLERLLANHGLTVLTARSAAEADDVLSQCVAAPDVLLSDIIIGGDNGVDYARELKGRQPSIAVIFMTGLAHRAPSALRSGLGPVLHKPFSAQELFRAIDELSLTL